MTYQEYYQREHLSKHFDYNKIKTVFKYAERLPPIFLFNYCLLKNQKAEGIQIYVQKLLSDELFNVDLKDIKFEDIIWPANSIEFYFEDTFIPTVILQKSYENKIKELNIMPTNDLTEKTPFDAFTMIIPQKGNDLIDDFIYATIGKNSISKWLHNDISQKAFDLMDEVLNSDDQQMTILYFRLIVKILLYISIPRYKAIEIHKNDLPKNSCKPGVKGRPKTKILKAIYVPEIHYIGQHSENDKLHGISKKPHMRRGHFRVLHSDKFVNKQHEIVYVKPCFIHGGSTENKLYIARKVNT